MSAAKGKKRKFLSSATRDASLRSDLGEKLKKYAHPPNETTEACRIDTGMLAPSIRHFLKAHPLLLLWTLLVRSTPVVGTGLGGATWAYMSADHQNTNKSDPLYSDLYTANYTNVTHALYSAAEFLAPDYALTYPSGFQRCGAV